MSSDLVSIVVVPGGWTEDVGRTVASAAAQEGVSVEVVLVDACDPALRVRSAVATVAARSGARVVEAPAASPGAARNAGIRAAAGAILVCLDEGDLLEPEFCLAAADALGVSAAAYAIASAVTEPGGEPFEPPLAASWDAAAVVGATLAAPVAVAFHRSAWEAAGGFDARLDALVAYDFLLRVHENGGEGVRLEQPALRRVARREAGYRASLHPERYLGAVSAIVERHRATFEADPPAVLFGRERALREVARQHRARVDRRDRLLAELGELTYELGRFREWLRRQGREAIDWGDLRRTSPVSRDWGYDRGKPVDRHYIERFLESHAGDIRGVALEVQENDFTTRYGGGRVERSDVVDLNPANPRATVVADLRQAITLASDTYDCVILTQTIHVIDDMRRVLEECQRVLKPGGVLLVTLPSASRVCLEYGRDGDFWRVTEAGARALFAQVFPAELVEVRGYGNVFTSAAFLYGLACEELTAEELDAYDPYFPLVVGVRAVKPSHDQALTARPRRAWRAAPPGAAILLYHRVAAPATDVHGLAIHPDHFDEHMAWLARHARPMTLVELAEAARERRLPPGAVAVTFDDGYVDNLTTARPLLERHGVPATFFVSSGPIDTGGEFWWDTLERLFFGPAPLPLEVPADLAAGAEALPAKTREERAAAHWAIYHRLVRLGAPERVARLDALATWGGVPRAPQGDARPMTADELRRLAGAPGATIGAHGVNHLALPALDPAERRAEVIGGKRRLEELLGTEVTTLAYPYGAWDAAAADLARACGFALAVTCDERGVEPGADRWRLPRVEVKSVLRGDLGRLLTRPV